MSRKKAFVHASLDRLKKSSLTIDVDISTAKFVIFSDHHRGRRDGADDFLNNETTYLQALEHYNKHDYWLVLLGDVEEFWENPLGSVIQSYPKVMEAEKIFSDREKITRIWGNHDDVWKMQGFFKKYLGTFLPNQKAHEAIQLIFKKSNITLGEMLLVHGHQGTFNSERLAGISRFFVRYGWRYIQKWFKFALSTPANNTRLKSDHDLIIYDWASNKSGQIIISGHTHQPVFMSLTHANFLQVKINQLSDQIALTDIKDQKTIESLIKIKTKAEDELKRILYTYHTTTLDVGNVYRKPCYFNSGCCSFSDGDITGLEIDHGRIRLIKWSIHNGRGRIVLEDSDLEQVFHACH